MHEGHQFQKNLYPLFNLQSRAQTQMAWMIDDMFMEADYHGFDPELLALKSLCELADFFLPSEDTKHQRSR